MKIQREHIGTPNKLRVISTNGSHGAHQGFSVEPGETYTFEIDLHRPAGMNKEINVVIWKNTGPSGAYTLHVLNTDGSNTFNRSEERRVGKECRSRCSPDQQKKNDGEYRKTS